MSTTSTSRRKSPSSTGGSVSTPVANIVLLTGAVGYGLWLLVSRGRVSWPPHELLTGAFTLAGCLALVGPVVLTRRERTESGLGDMAWMTAGLLIWAQNLTTLINGSWPDQSWATPLASLPLGLTTLAVMLSGWWLQGSTQSRNWSWTNVVGWILGVFWIAVGLSTLVPESISRMVSR